MNDPKDFVFFSAGMAARTYCLQHPSRHSEDIGVFICQSQSFRADGSVLDCVNFWLCEIMLSSTGEQKDGE